MANKLFHEVYYSESIVDLPRDVNECFDARFNPEAENIDEFTEIHVRFVFTHDIKTVVMHDRTYSMEELNDIEENLHDSLSDLDISDIPECDGFFEGDMTLDITYTNEEE